MRGRLPAPIEYTLDPGVSSDEVVLALGERGDVAEMGRSTCDRTFLDTFDRRLEARGLTLELAASTLVLRDRGRVVATAGSHGPARGRLFAHEISAAAAWAQLAGVTRERALLPEARVRSRQRAVAISNADGKVVVRLVFDEPRVVRAGRGSHPLATRLQVSPVLGYDRPFAVATAVLAQHPGVRVAARSLGAEAAGPPGPTELPPPLVDHMRADAATVALCGHLADAVEANLDGVLADLDTEFLHDLRVAVRRSRSVLREMKGVLPAASRDRAQADLRWVQQITGATRDLDVQLLEWSAAMAELGPEAASDLEPLRELLTLKRARAWRAMCRQLRSARYRDAWEDWRKLLGNAVTVTDAEAAPNGARDVADVAGARIRAVYGRMVKTGRTVDDTTAPEVLHDLRKRGKELRYLLELFGSLWPADAGRRLVASVKDLQDVLGRFQDREVEAAYLRSLGPELAARPGGADALIALGSHLDRLAVEQRRARDAFATKFASFSSATNRRVVKATFG